MACARGYSGAGAGVGAGVHAPFRVRKAAHPGSADHGFHVGGLKVFAEVSYQVHEVGLATVEHQ